jgi:ribosomal protein L24
MDKIRKNDEVIVLTGKDKGKRGVVNLASRVITLWLKALTSLKKRPSRTQ